MFYSSKRIWEASVLGHDMKCEVHPQNKNSEQTKQTSFHSFVWFLVVGSVGVGFTVVTHLAHTARSPIDPQRLQAHLGTHGWELHACMST